MNTNERQPIKTSTDIEIGIDDIMFFFKTNQRLIAAWSLSLTIIGIIYALLAQKEFESKTQLMPELQSTSALGKMGGLSALAGLAGIDLNQMSTTDAVRPDLYPNILQSLPFALYILKESVYVSEYQKTMKLEDFLYLKEQSLISTLINEGSKSQTTLLDPKKSSKAYELTKNQQDLVTNIQERVQASFDRKSGVISINVKMPDPVVAATITQRTVEYLKNYVTSYRTDKARNQVKFFENQVADAKRRYQNAESKLAQFRDFNRFLALQTAKIEEQRLQAEFLLSQNLYNNLTQQFEQAKIRVEEETPVFKTLEPATIPLKRSEPKRSLIVLGFGIIGTIIGIIISLLKNNTFKLKTK
ncbi:GNVR domain-containing protein [Runella limosa]|uniref:GNVR domain-containing protein n=1 Tax=Runella limosa TaxID=370978 RepID=UPI0003FB7AB2|nr:GNVR domain-containing protein [Runella limosa]